MIYKTETFGCTFSTKKRFNQQLQQVLDIYAAEGWKLHSWQVVAMGEFCTVVFYREEED